LHQFVPYFRSTINSVGPLARDGLNGYINEDGIAKVTITKNGRTITATFAPNQLYPPGAPSAFLGADLTGAVSEIIANPVVSDAYTPGVALLAQVSD
jgi:hypothetical protein